MGFVWKVEELALKKERDRQGRFFETFEVERTINRDDKISFIDSQMNGQMSELLALYNKFQKEKDTIKKGVDGYYKENSLKAWYSKNAGTLNWSEYDFGFYGIFHNRTIYNLMHKGNWEIYDDIVDEAFHRLLDKLYNEEVKYFNTHDEYQILKNKLINSHILPLTGIHYWYGTSGIGKEVNGKNIKFTLEELRYLDKTCDKLEEKINNAAAKIRAEFESKFPN